MKMNAKKTKTMLVSNDVTLTKVSLTIDSDIIKQTDKYTYLGHTTTSWKMDDDILKIIEIARSAFHSMLKTTHKYENKKNNYKNICVVDTFIRM